MKQLLIVGIDPGVTVGYALLDVKGNVVKLDSAKELDLDTLVSKVVSFGIPLIVGCDKAKVPGFVEKFAIKVGAKLVSPKEDMKTGEKRGLTKGMDFNNEHELDALASALFAFKKSEGLFRRIDKFLAGKNKSEFADHVKELVVKKGIHMSGALDLLTEPGQKEVKIIKKVVEEKKLDEKDFLKMYNELKKLEQDRKRLRQQNMELQEKLKKSEKESFYFKSRSENKSKTSSVDRIKFKENKIHFLDKKIGEKDKKILRLKNEIKKLHNVLAGIEDKIVVKKLQNLGWNEFSQKKPVLKIKKKDILLVDDPNSFSEKTLDLLKGVVDIIIHKKELGKKLEQLDFVFISANALQFEENEHFAFVNKGSFEEARRSKELLKSIIKAYKKERAD